MNHKELRLAVNSFHYCFRLGYVLLFFLCAQVQMSYVEAVERCEKQRPGQMSGLEPDIAVSGKLVAVLSRLRDAFFRCFAASAGVRLHFGDRDIIYEATCVVLIGMDFAVAGQPFEIPFRGGGFGAVAVALQKIA